MPSIATSNTFPIALMILPRPWIPTSPFLHLCPIGLLHTKPSRSTNVEPHSPAIPFQPQHTPVLYHIRRINHPYLPQNIHATTAAPTKPISKFILPDLSGANYPPTFRDIVDQLAQLHFIDFLSPMRKRLSPVCRLTIHARTRVDLSTPITMTRTPIVSHALLKSSYNKGNVP
ncbi:hypothetical protein WMY93_023034 [Mugilogobius chulae]|uniref:Uncharacterized protein n=1 Tax=Mugilogobius chulae TaxID=88201 RepID=A0AAW0N498_9GOBI